MQHYIGRKAMNIDGMGDETIETLYRQEFINTSVIFIFCMSVPMS
jgi:NAD-dependent DNA ligase